MLKLQEFRDHSLRAVLAQCLVALFFFQALLPIQAHSRIAVNDQGIAVVICTLQGDKTVTLDLEGADHGNTAPSAAMLFSDLINDLTPVHGVLRPTPMVLGRAQVLKQEISHVAVPATVESHSRAPPRA